MHNSQGAMCFSAYVASPLRVAARGVGAVRWPRRSMVDAFPVLPCSEGGVGGYVATVRVCRTGSCSVALRVGSRVLCEYLGNDVMSCLAPLLMAAALGAAPVRRATHLHIHAPDYPRDYPGG